MLESGDLGGKCADINSLYVGLARAAGLPARDFFGVRVADSNIMNLLLGGVFLLRRIHRFAIRLVVPPGIAKVSGDHIRTGVHVADHALAGGGGPDELVVDRVAGLVLGDHRIGREAHPAVAELGEGAKANHLSYIGDADIGAGTNLGAATITANYDGTSKHRTTIGSGVHTSVDTTLVAPVTLGDEASTAAGSVITEDVPPGALGIARERQTNIDGYADRRRKSS